MRGEPIAAAMASLVTLACGMPSSPATVLPALDSACLLASATDVATEPIVVALTDPIDPRHALAPHNQSERLLFAHLYETLIEVDCLGRVRAGLAESWMPEEQGRRWQLVLRPDAVFWNGEPVTAGAVVEAWAQTRSSAASPLLDSVTVVGDRVLRVTLPRPVTSPTLLAAPGLAVAKPSTQSAWVTGTGPLRMPVDLSTRPTITLGRAGDGEVTVEFLLAPSTDPRDMLDEQIDVLVTDQPAVIAYASAGEAFAVVPLPWSRTYVLLSPERVGTGDSGTLDGSLLDGLARDAVRVQGRRAEHPLWWETVDMCDAHTAAAARPVIRSPPSSARRVVYAAADAAARGLAERLVALAATPSGGRSLSNISAGWADASPPLIAAGLDPDTFALRLRAGSEFAYVLVMPRRVLDACRELSAISDRVPWAHSRTDDVLRGVAAVAVPLVDTRMHAVLRRGRVFATTDWDGTVRLLFP